MKRLVDALEDVLQLIDSPEKWAQGALAVDVNRVAVSPLDDRAAAWCLAGAVRRVADNELFWVEVCGFLDQRARDEFHTGTVEANDNMLRSYEDMRLFLKRAIAEAETL